MVPRDFGATCSANFGLADPAQIASQVEKTGTNNGKSESHCRTESSSRRPRTHTPRSDFRGNHGYNRSLDLTGLSMILGHSPVHPDAISHEWRQLSSGLQMRRKEDRIQSLGSFNDSRPRTCSFLHVLPHLFGRGTQVLLSTSPNLLSKLFLHFDTDAVHGLNHSIDCVLPTIQSFMSSDQIKAHLDHQQLS